MGPKVNPPEDSKIPALVSLWLRVEEGVNSRALPGRLKGYRVGSGSERKFQAKK